MVFDIPSKVPSIGTTIQITIPGEPDEYLLEVAVIARWAKNPGNNKIINIPFMLPRGTFPLELASRSVTYNTETGDWTISIKNKDGGIRVKQVTVIFDNV